MHRKEKKSLTNNKLTNRQAALVSCDVCYTTNGLASLGININVRFFPSSYDQVFRAFVVI